MNAQAQATVDQNIAQVKEAFKAEDSGNLRTLARLQANQRITGHDYRRLTYALVIALDILKKDAEEVAELNDTPVVDEETGAESLPRPDLIGIKVTSVETGAQGVTTDAYAVTDGKGNPPEYRIQTEFGGKSMWYDSCELIWDAGPFAEDDE